MRTEGRSSPKSPLDEEPIEGGLTYRELNEYYVKLGAERRVEDGEEVIVFKTAPLFVDKTAARKAADVGYLDVLERINRDLFDRIDAIIAKLKTGVSVKEL